MVARVCNSPLPKTILETQTNITQMCWTLILLSSFLRLFSHSNIWRMFCQSFEPSTWSNSNLFSSLKPFSWIYSYCIISKQFLLFFTYLPWYGLTSQLQPLLHVSDSQELWWCCCFSLECLEPRLVITDSRILLRLLLTELFDLTDLSDFTDLDDITDRNIFSRKSAVRIS